MNTLLALDASSEHCSVALEHQGKVFERERHAPREHHALLLSMVESVLQEAHIAFDALSAIAVTIGPGSLTGVRLACAYAQALAFAHRLPLLPISTLATLAYGTHVATQAHRIWVALDARMQHIYFAQYEWDDAKKLLCAKIPDQVTLKTYLPLPRPCAQHLGSTDVVGDGWFVWPHLYQPSMQVYPKACDMLPLAQWALAAGNTVTPELLQPNYLFNQFKKNAE